MAELTSMMNIGKEMEKKLTSIGIESSEEHMKQAQKTHFSG